ncbi:phosphoribosylaminoimidazolesuccinocarboxamide synthase [Actinopolymorpha sp. B9G3]|uniref:phosphoribosylaminoimidazolesuccinocarboxamide synthase n=1 Tax=Actinopolymorpha sp. B9G3 TaxID=3158970 RepID=UPI0032D9662F
MASDRVSVYDVVLPTPIPDKGKLLTAPSVWWFEQLNELITNNLLSATDVPEDFAGRAIRCQRLEILPVQWVARGYLAGMGWDSYREG